MVPPNVHEKFNPNLSDLANSGIRPPATDYDIDDIAFYPEKERARVLSNGEAIGPKPESIDDLGKVALAEVIYLDDHRPSTHPPATPNAAAA